MEVKSRWICPPMSSVSEKSKILFDDILSLISKSNFDKMDIIDTAGVEVRCSMMALLREEYFQELRDDNVFWKEKCRIILLRNCVEPIQFTYWDSLLDLEIDLNKSLKLASALAGKELVYRVKDGVGRSSEGDVLFEPIDIMRGWLDRLKVAKSEKQLSSVFPVVSYATVIMAHPFSDGNGRFARTLLHAAIASRLKWPCPVLALAPAFYRHGSSMRKAFHKLNEHQDWDYFVASLGDVINDAHSMTRLTLRKYRS